MGFATGSTTKILSDILSLEMNDLLAMTIWMLMLPAV